MRRQGRFLLDEFGIQAPKTRGKRDLVDDVTRIQLLNMRVTYFYSCLI